MTQIAYSAYELIPRSGGPGRSGALIRIQDGPGIVGYADCHPWPELGDAPLEHQLRCLRLGEQTPLTKQSWRLAVSDLAIRKGSVSVFAGFQSPANHASLPNGLRQGVAGLEAQIDQLASRGFSLVKVKAGDHPEVEIEALRSMMPVVAAHGIKVRIDLNSKFDGPTCEQFLERAGVEPEWVDWVEDPMPYDPVAWDNVRAKFGVRLALDRADYARDSAVGIDVIVVKPAVDDHMVRIGFASRHNLGICVTSYLDHPLGQVCALWISKMISSTRGSGAALEACGLATQDVYEETEFSRCLAMDGTRLVPPQGPGFGFTEELEALDWREF